MLDHLGYPDAASRVVGAIEAATAAGRTTPDLGGPCTTREATDAILAHLTHPVTA